MYNDGINQIGKYVGKTGKNANRALKKSEPDYGADEIARDIFDPVVSYVMYFTTSRPNQSIITTLKFELPPPNIGLGKCCGDCYCSKCETFFFDDFDSQIILTEYPYVADTVRIFDAYGNTSLVTETDPDAGIVDLGYDPEPSDTNKIYVCYVYKYDQNCTTNAPVPETPEEPNPSPSSTCFEELFNNDISFIAENDEWNSDVELGDNWLPATTSYPYYAYLDAPEDSTSEWIIEGGGLTYHADVDAGASYSADALATGISPGNKQHVIIQGTMTFNQWDSPDNSSIFILYYEADDIVTPYTEQHRVEMSVYSGTLSMLNSVSDTANSNPATQHLDETDFFVSTETLYAFKLEVDYTSSYARFKMWFEGFESEPDWMVVAPFDGARGWPSSPDFNSPWGQIFFLTEPGFTDDVTIHDYSIECFEDGPLYTIIDSFNRANSSTSLGSAVPSGDTWIGTSDTLYHYGISGGRGLIGIKAFTDDELIQYQAQATLISTLYPYPIDMQFTLYHDALDMTAWFLTFGEDGNPVEFSFVPSAGTVQAQGWVEQGDIISGYDFSLPYYVRLYVGPDSIMKFKLWRLDEDEPVAWDDEFQDPGGSDATETYIMGVRLVQIRLADVAYDYCGITIDNIYLREPDSVTPPPATGRPFNAPTTTATYEVPDAIDRTGATNAADDLQSWIDSTVPDGSIIDFSHAGGIYRLDDGLLFEGRNNLIIRGNSDTTLVMNGSDAETFSTFLMRNSHHIAIEDFTVNGAYDSFPGQDGELSHCLGISGFFAGGASTYIEMSGVTGDHFYGDFVYVEGSNGGSFPPAQYIWVHHNNFDYCGRNGFSFINVQDAWFQYNTLDHIAYHAVDFEANFDPEETTRIVVELNDFGSYGHRSGLIGYFVAAFSPNNPSVSEITIRNNTVDGIAANGYNGAPLGLHSKFLGTSGNHYTYITFTGNTCTQTVSGSSIIYFDYVDHATVTGNTQPGAGTLVGAANSTDITSNPNP